MEAGATTVTFVEPGVADGSVVVFDVTASGTPRALGDALAWRPLLDGKPTPLSQGGRLVPFLVDHAPPDGGALGCVVEVDGARIAYSGDTRPCERLIEVARGADLLLHEAGGFDRVEQHVSAASAAERSTSRVKVARIAIEWPTITGTRTHVGLIARPGRSRILRDSFWSFISSSV